MENFKGMNLYAKGRRSYIFVKKINNKKVAFKVVINKKRTKNVIKNEYKYLKILNNYKIGPKLLSHKENYISYEFVDGMQIVPWMKKSPKRDILSVIKKILLQCYVMDRLNINKKELHHPIKHILVKNKTPIMIDFERCYSTKKPKNVTQFCQFLISYTIANILNDKKIKIKKLKLINRLKLYKKDVRREKFNKIIELVGSS